MQIRKRNGQVVEFEKQKIFRILSTVGVASQEADRISNDIEKWASSQGGIVTTMQVKERVTQMVTPETAEKMRQFMKG